MSNSSSSTAGTLMVISGVLNVLASATYFFGLVWFCVGFAWLIPMAIGVAEIVVGAAIMGGRPTHRVRAVSALGILGGLMTMNVFSIGLEIGSLVQQGSDPHLLDG